jgi:hypothetical protein
MATLTYEDRNADQEMPASAFEGGALPRLPPKPWDFDDANEMRKRYPKLFAKRRRGQ